MSRSAWVEAGFRFRHRSDTRRWYEIVREFDGRMYMSGRRWLVVTVAAVIALGAGVGIGAMAWAGGDHGGSGMSMMSGSSAHDGASGTADSGAMGLDMSGMDERTFMEMMVPHHQSAIDMAELAVQKAQRPQVRRLARGIVAAGGRDRADGIVVSELVRQEARPTHVGTPRERRHVGS